ncbi:MAG TPA: hypothetical protein VLR91_02475 [Thermodesulfobacteriota bacterium]|nr:hypothetical protein [Thermodesulfobacteriota bacterium]
MTRFDRVIPPGGEGKVTLTVTLKGYQGRVWKDATVISNDLRQPSFQIMLQGKVRPHIELRPGPSVQFSPAAQSLAEKIVDLVATSQDFNILKVENNLKEKIGAQLETIVPGKHYRLKIANLQQEGSYSGVIKCFTDHPQKPDVQIRINVHFPPAK